MTYYLAIDIGASSGRHVLVHKYNDKIFAEEIYRFDNHMTECDSHLCWDVDNLYSEVINGMKKCREINRIPYSLSIDTWGVDYVLLDKNDSILGRTYSYRDQRTKDMDKIVSRMITEDELYKRTGIQKQIFNTIYQITALKEQEAEVLKKAKVFLMMPDYLHYKLTGIKSNEYTNATTTGLVNCHTKDWDFELIKMLGIPKHIFRDLKMPMNTIGVLTAEIQEEVGFVCNVTACATHDTGSAVVSVPTTSEDSIFLSSGTWSLLGFENIAPIVSEESRIANFTNEGGFNYRYRHLKNIMGLWMIQCIYHEFDEKYSYEEICKMAEKEKIDTLVDCNDERFFAPVSMSGEIKLYAKETKQRIPESMGQIAAVVYNSLAACYKNAIDEIDRLTGRHFDSLNIIGGGANADYLNKRTAQTTGLKVIAGPTEATAIGNALCQMIANDKFENIADARECIKKSFNLKEYGESK